MIPNLSVKAAGCSASFSPLNWVEFCISELAMAILLMVEIDTLAQSLVLSKITWASVGGEELEEFEYSH